MEKINSRLVGQRFYVFKEIGEGGMSEVYKAKDIFTKKTVAMKKYKTSDPANEEKILEGMDSEVTVLKNCTHPCLPKILNLIRYKDSYYLIMEYIEGYNLQYIMKNAGNDELDLINIKALVDKKGRFRKKEALKIIEDVISALYYLHSLQPPIVYRDLKPSNIIKMKNGIKLIDFGVAKRYSRDISNDKFAYGTKGFAAPEQFGTKDGKGIFNTDIRTDVYGVGTTLYTLLCNKIYSVDEKISLWDRIRMGRGIYKIIKKATMINPDKRYQNVLDLLVDLKKYIKKNIYSLRLDCFVV